MTKFKWTWETAPKSPGAGIVVVRFIDNNYKVLGLWARGGYDIPKGHVEDGEGFLQTAIRETQEESSITDLQFRWGQKPIIVDQLKVYLAETNQAGEVVANEHSGILEHEHLKWMDWDEMYEKTYDYLRPAVLWAKESVEVSETK
jgi:8-oxo-dGTP pyrophosphatase MutT (NUDIX family)